MAHYILKNDYLCRKNQINRIAMLIGRNKELRVLQEAYESEYSEFVVVYGRRRVGKTFLIREKFNYTFSFHHSGLANEKLKQQLLSFGDSLRKCGMDNATVPSTWFEAFNQLEELITQSKDHKKVIFIDEMPWMDTPRSHFVSALEHFWNGFASARKDVLLIICGSATSWMVKNVFKNRGGLHNRVTKRIHLHPFTLNECEQFATSRNLAFSRYELLTCYMVMGGIPYYWAALQKGMGADQNIDALFFGPDAEFGNEFDELYASLFSHPDPYINVIATLGKKRIGMTRNELIREANVKSNGRLSSILRDLENCDFIRSYQTFGKAKNDMIYQLTDNYTLFYFKFINDNDGSNANYWTRSNGTGTRNAWNGLAFEQVCFAHIPQIKKKLGIAGVSTKVSSWRVQSDDELGPGAQIDLLIERADHVINICEIKFSDEEYLIDKQYNLNLRWKRGRFARTTKTKFGLQLTMITTMGLVPNSYANEIQSQITADDLFEPGV